MSTLFKRTFLLLAVSMMSIVAIFVLSHVREQRDALIDVMHSKSRTVAKSIALVTSDAMVTEDYSFIVEHTQSVLQDNDEFVYILVTKRNGETIRATAEAWNVMAELPENVAKMQKNREDVSEIIQSSLYPEAVYHMSYPVIFSGIEWGWVAIGLSLDRYHERIDVLYRDSAILLGMVLFASILFSYILARWLVGPIVELNLAAKRVSSGDLSTRVDVNSADEIGELAGSFNAMVEALEDSNRTMRSYNVELERRVEERTEALNRLNRELDTRVKSESLKRAEQERMLIQQSRFAAMGEMIGNIAHQWRQPLNAIALLLQNIQFAHEFGKLDKEFIERSVEKGQRLTTTMSQTIDDFRNFFKPNRAQEAFRISDALNTAFEIMRSALENHGIMIVTEVDEELCVVGFPNEFSQVLLNILNNAKDALDTQEETMRRIDVRVFSKGEDACIEIEDSAGGISEGIIEKVFDPYFTTKDEGKGTGIGLYMSKMIIETNMHGRLDVRNTPTGALFSISMKRESCEGVEDA